MKTANEIDEFVKLIIQFGKALTDINELSKKKPNDAVNKFKLKFVNTLLNTANKIIDDKNKPFDSFEVFDEDDLPSNSDVVLILSQYLACLKKFGKEQTQYSDYKYYWVLNGKRTNISVDINLLN